MAIRGTVSRRELREVIAATYHQVWWPSTTAVRFDGDSTYLDPETGEVLPTWDQALDAISDQDEPLHVAQFGDRFDAQGVLAGSRDANRCIGYLTKYLTKHLGDCHELATDKQAAHAGRLAEALRWEPCSPTCANWLRYGIQLKNPKKGVRPGACKGEAHRREYLGYAGRRVLTSRKWSGKTLPTTAPTAKPGSPRCSVFRQPTRRATPGSWSSPGTRTTCPPGNDCCTSSPTGCTGSRPSTKPADEPTVYHRAMFRQPGGQHERNEHDGGLA